MLFFVLHLYLGLDVHSVHLIYFWLHSLSGLAQNLCQYICDDSQYKGIFWIAKTWTVWQVTCIRGLAEGEEICETSLVWTQHSFNPHSRWKLCDATDESWNRSYILRRTQSTLTFSSPPHLSLPLFLPFTHWLPQSLINSPVLSRCLNLSLSPSHSQTCLIFVLWLARYSLYPPLIHLPSVLPFFHFSLFCWPISALHGCTSALKGPCYWHSPRVVMLTISFVSSDLWRIKAWSWLSNLSHSPPSLSLCLSMGPI